MSSEPSSGRSVGGADRRRRRADRCGDDRQRDDDEGRRDGASRGWNSGSRSSIRVAFASRLAGLNTGPVSVAVGLFRHAVTRLSKVCSLIFSVFLLVGSYRSRRRTAAPFLCIYFRHLLACFYLLFPFLSKLLFFLL